MHISSSQNKCRFCSLWGDFVFRLQQYYRILHFAAAVIFEGKDFSIPLNFSPFSFFFPLPPLDTVSLVRWFVGDIISSSIIIIISISIIVVIVVVIVVISTREGESRVIIRMGRCKMKSKGGGGVERDCNGKDGMDWVYLDLGLGITSRLV